MTLDFIACQEGTDRASNGLHDYMRTYGEIFYQIRYDPIALLEIGVLGGAGIRTWARYFAHPSARIYGLDPHPEFCQPIEDARVQLLNCRQEDTEKLNTLLGLTVFNICIDDGGHFASAQIKSFNALWPRIVPGGFYCAEDLHTYAAPELCDGPENIMAFLTRIATEMQGRGAKAIARPEPSDLWPDIDTIMFRKGLCVLRKKPFTLPTSTTAHA